MVFPLFVSLALCPSDIQVVTANYDQARTNSNLNEKFLNHSNVRPGTFGKVLSIPVDGQVYAQPLYVSGLTMGSHGTRNVLFVATMHNTVYAFDAETGDILWQINLGPAVPSYLYDFFDIEPEIGILSTPVIDVESNAIYLVSNQYQSGAFSYRLYALDLVTAANKNGSPSTISAEVDGIAPDSVNGRLPFRAFDHLQRPGLALANGNVYVGFGSHSDTGDYHGWLIAVDAANVRRVKKVFNASPDGGASALWQGGRAPAVDAAGNIVVVTANGDYDGQTNFGNSILRLRADDLTVESSFTPADWEFLNDTDFDLGSSGAILVPGTDLIVTGGKAGLLHVVSANAMYGLDREDEPIGQTFLATGFGMFSMALWPRGADSLLYVRGSDAPVMAYRLTGDGADKKPVSMSEPVDGISYQGMAVTANGAVPGTAILWMSSQDDVLHAYDAGDLSRELWSSALNDQEDHLGIAAKFSTPTIANGRVYVSNFTGSIEVYGLLEGACGQ
ncbi:MAG: PQQ-binding-like beta-propeller repeat protein [Bryobacteraceae bacterium]